jgi:hypothetical protein
MQLKLHYTNNPLIATTTSLAPELENFVRARATAAVGIHNTQSPSSRTKLQLAKALPKGREIQFRVESSSPKSRKSMENGVILM